MVVAPPSVVAPGVGLVPSGATGACPGQLFFGAVPSAKYSVCLLHASLLASYPVSVQIVFFVTVSGISKATDSYLFVS